MTAAEVFVRALPAPLAVAAAARRYPDAALVGEAECALKGIAGLGHARAGTLTFCDAPDGNDTFMASAASLIIVPLASTVAPRPGVALLRAADVRALFIDLVEWQLPGAARPPCPAAGIDRSARIDPSADVSPLAAIGANVVIGARTRIEPGAMIYADTVIGADCCIGPNAVLGHVGLAYHDRADGRRLFFPHLGGVRIGERVDVGANTCVCRGMLSHTRIGDDAKLGSLVYVSHGVVVGERAWISAGTAVAGHARVDATSVLGIGTVVVDNVVIGAGTVVAGGCVVTRDADAGSKMAGVPAHAVPTLRRFGPTPRE